MRYPKKGKNTHRKTVIRYCLKVWADIIKSIGKCELCGRTDLQLHAHHIIKRGWRFSAGWFLLNNGISLCYKCHQYAHSPHWKTQEKYQEQILNHLKGKIDYEVLYLQCRSGKVDLELIKIALKQERDKKCKLDTPKN